ncbi:MAG: hypothetical protein AAB834_06035, partial [Patescibacteria group bacterium]
LPEPALALPRPVRLLRTEQPPTEAFAQLVWAAEFPVGVVAVAALLVGMAFEAAPADWLQPDPYSAAVHMAWPAADWHRVVPRQALLVD